ncbi:MAG: thiamine biosynthesis protein ApbE [Bacteroidetes bacterium]|nr:thiamine biosynthesis protein ApbE [Bacteroidota bacterium]
MGNHFEISVVAADAFWARQRIEAGVKEIRRIEALLTTFSDQSETNKINENAGIRPVVVSQEIIDLIMRAKKISDVTQGAFDISYGSVDKSLWNFDTHMTALPDKKTAKKSVRLINYKNIEVDSANHTVLLKEKGMRIGFGGIGKGYAAEMAKLVMKRMGVESGVVNASGDLTAWGTQPNGIPWTIGIANPNLAREIFSYMNITDMAVATSGNYEKYVMIDGKRYSHTIDPKTGLPVSGIKSVTIISSNAEVADAMATPVTIMGVKAGLHMINQIKNIEAIIVTDDDKLFTSKNFNLIR